LGVVARAVNTASAPRTASDGNSTRCGHWRSIWRRPISPLQTMTCPPYEATFHRRTAISFLISVLD
jgi:hypothetical protein